MVIVYRKQILKFSGIYRLSECFVKYNDAAVFIRLCPYNGSVIFLLHGIRGIKKVFTVRSKDFINLCGKFVMLFGTSPLLPLLRCGQRLVKKPR